jgi:[ribosomal protein S18]-alanine N-acetyltransferase
LQILEANLTDLEAIVAIEQIAQVLPWSRQALQACFVAGYHNWLARDAAAVQGFVLTRQVLDEIEIMNLAVYPTQQRQGIASALLQQLITHCEQQAVRRIYLEVRQSNVAARQLYQKFGFVLDGIRTAYYRLPHGGMEDAWCMSKTNEIFHLCGKVIV